MPWCCRGPVSEARAACIFQSILELVGHCHALGIMHRDLKVSISSKKLRLKHMSLMT